MGKIQRETFKKRYEFVCCECGAKLWAEPSFSMLDFGLNRGHASCPKCSTLLYLKISPNLAGESMISMMWNEFLEREGKEVNCDC